MRIIYLLPLALLTSCASITTGTNQVVNVQTTPLSGARCELANDKGTWVANTTPSSVSIKRSYSNLSVNCRKDNHTGTTSVHSSTKGMAFGNILFGGIIGGAVDAGSGAAYDYPANIIVHLEQSK